MWLKFNRRLFASLIFAAKTSMAVALLTSSIFYLLLLIINETGPDLGLFFYVFALVLIITAISCAGCFWVGITFLHGRKLDLLIPVFSALMSFAVLAMATQVFQMRLVISTIALSAPISIYLGMRICRNTLSKLESLK